MSRTTRPSRGSRGPTALRHRCRLLATLCLACTPALAADLGVQVLDKVTGHAVEGASVCLGTPAEPQQLGGRRTPANGSVSFRDLPSAPLTLVVTAPSYAPERRSVEATLERQAVMILLAKGRGPSFSCSIPAPAQPVVEAAPLQIPGFRINGGATSTTNRRVTLDFAIPQGANSYRASESPELAGSDWAPLPATPTFELSAKPGEKTVFLQVRRYRHVDGASLETRSGVTSATIVLQGSVDSRR